MTTAPLAPCVTAVILSGSPSASLSFTSTLIAFASLSSTTLAASLTATGGRRVAFTVIDTAATLELPRPSLTRYVKPSAPLKPAFGV
jgi:hypothetical protein